MEEPRKPVVIDTNILLHAISCGSQEGPDNNSPLDRGTRNRGISPEQIRGSLMLLLAETRVIIPEVVVKEILSKKTQELLGARNLSNLMMVLGVVANRTTPLVPSRIEVIRQNVGFAKIETKAQAAAQSLRDQGFDIPGNWPELLDPEERKAKPPVGLLLKSQACKTWAKIHRDLGKVRNNILDLPTNGETTQVKLLESAKEIEARLDRPETTQKEIDELSATQANAEMAAAAARPYILPDAEITFLARRNKAEIYTLDKDIDLLRHEMPGGPGEPTKSTTTGPWATIEDLVQALKENLRGPTQKQVKRPPQAPETPAL
jgi:hypothetical protein